MKTVLLTIAMIATCYLNAQQTFVPDNNFEAYLEANGMGNGVLNDDSVTTANISGVTDLNVQQLSISSLRGIEGFEALVNLTCRSNDLTTLDLAQNVSLVSLSCYLNQLSSLDLSNNTSLSWLDCSWNQIVSLDFTQNLSITHLYCSGNTLSVLDISQNIALTNIACHDNQLTCLNIKNGYNGNLEQLLTFNNSSLSCMEVDDRNWVIPSWSNVDAGTAYSDYCNNSCSTGGVGLSELTVVDDKKLIKVVDLLGRETKVKPNILLIYIYSDGSTQRKFIIEE